MRNKTKYPIGTRFTIRPDKRNDGLLIWEVISPGTMRCISSGNTWNVGETFDCVINESNWFIEPPKENLFDKLYLRML